MHLDTRTRITRRCGIFPSSHRSQANLLSLILQSIETKGLPLNDQAPSFWRHPKLALPPSSRKHKCLESQPSFANHTLTKGYTVYKICWKPKLPHWLSALGRRDHCNEKELAHSAHISHVGTDNSIREFGYLSGKIAHRLPRKLLCTFLTNEIKLTYMFV